ncbi:hypothetical protein CARUB_v10018668mg [Capsella rubella]|uniref:Uncharacterized protein n=1 Tax=Capsella rubella TaxID=81985 RepID=R0HJF2_9BRAS|nr:hypothetical protein CARUB_v10018668mg [Capsella rubella]
MTGENVKPAYGGEEDAFLIGKLAQCQAVANMKFTYVVSCQQYGIHKRSGDPRAQDILRLMIDEDHELALMDAIAKLEEISDGESGNILIGPF